MTQRHPQQEKPHRHYETLREGLTEAQIDIIAQGFQLIRRLCSDEMALPLPDERAKAMANQAIDLLDAFAKAGDND